MKFSYFEEIRVVLKVLLMVPAQLFSLAGRGRESDFSGC